MNFQGREFQIVVASDITTRDGLGVELWEDVAEEHRQIAEVFRSDSNGSMEFSGYERDVPLAAIEYLLEYARETLTPHGDAA
jgi:hypothetical protein